MSWTEQILEKKICVTEARIVCRVLPARGRRIDQVEKPRIVVFQCEREG